MGKKSKHVIQPKSTKSEWIDHPLVSVALGLAALLAMLPMLATNPQSGDGAEILRVAVNGGVVHPPGFPFQMWLNRWVALVPIGTASERISLISLIGHIGTFVVIVEVLRRLKVSFMARLAAGGAYLLFPTVWYLGVQPEVFSLAFFIIALIILQAVHLITHLESSHHLLHSFLLGVLVAIAAAQHPITVVSAPAFFTSLYLLAIQKRIRWVPFAVSATSFWLIVSFLFGSLLLMKSDVLWPNWGELQTAKDVIDHALRSEYGTFSLSIKAGSFSGLEVLAKMAGSYWNILLLLIPFGILTLYKGNQTHYSIVITGTFATALLFLTKATLGGQQPIAEATLERFLGTALVPATILLGLGFRWLAEKLNNSLAIQLAGIAFIGVLGFRSFDRANAAGDNTAHVFSKALGASLPKNVLYLGFSDIEAGYGIETTKGTVYPIQTGLLRLDWYRNRVARKTAPDFNFTGMREAEDVIKRAYENNIPVAGIDVKQLKGENRKVTMVGPFFVAHPNARSELTPQSVELAKKMCPIISELKPLPKQGHMFSRAMINVLARVYDGASQFLKATNKPKASEKARGIYLALSRKYHLGGWAQACSDFSSN